MQALITTWENTMSQKLNAYERRYMWNTYVSNFPSLQRGFSPSLRETWQRRKFKDGNREGANKTVQKWQRKDVRGGNDMTNLTAERREIKWF